jgi:hypothetical protein
MNIFYTILTFLQDFWNLLGEFMDHMRPQFIQYDDIDKAK